MQDPKVHRLAKIEKWSPLVVDYTPTGRMSVRVWRREGHHGYAKPNAMAREAIPGGAAVVIGGSAPGMYEVRPA